MRRSRKQDVRERESNNGRPLEWARPARLRVARIAIFVFGVAFFLLGTYLITSFGPATFFAAPLLIAIGGTGIYTALRSPDHLLIKWLGRIFVGI